MTKDNIYKFLFTINLVGLNVCGNTLKRSEHILVDDYRILSCKFLKSEYRIIYIITQLNNIRIAMQSIITLDHRYSHWWHIHDPLIINKFYNDSIMLYFINDISKGRNIKWRE